MGLTVAKPCLELFYKSVKKYCREVCYKIENCSNITLEMKLNNFIALKIN